MYIGSRSRNSTDSLVRLQVHALLLSPGSSRSIAVFALEESGVPQSLSSRRDEKNDEDIHISKMSLLSEREWRSLGEKAAIQANERLDKRASIK
ncbi:unnamed protein product [Lasius platythorax]|uniref:Uncharacterized protein n=1 Tax=Lasius platythorax TaxID=488582 RepID=A0AAV2NK90_9HYME